MKLTGAVIDKWAKEVGVSRENMSSMLSGNRPVGRKRAKHLEDVSKKLNYTNDIFLAPGWMFHVSKIKNFLLKEIKNNK